MLRQRLRDISGHGIARQHGSQLIHDPQTSLFRHFEMRRAGNSIELV